MLTLTGEDSAADGGPEDAVTRDHSSGRQDEKVFHENNDWLGGSGSFSEERDEGNVVSLLLAPASSSFQVHPHDAASSYVMTLNCHDWLLQFQVPKLKAARVSPVHHLSRAMAKKRVKKQNKKVCSGR